MELVTHNKPWRYIYANSKLFKFIWEGLNFTFIVFCVFHFSFNSIHWFRANSKLMRSGCVSVCSFREWVGLLSNIMFLVVFCVSSVNHHYIDNSRKLSSDHSPPVHTASTRLLLTVWSRGRRVDWMMNSSGFSCDLLQQCSLTVQHHSLDGLVSKCEFKWNRNNCFYYLIGSVAVQTITRKW